MSRSVSPVKGLHNDAAEDSDTEMNGQDTVSKKIRGAAARNHERKLREDREKARLEAANKRKGRAERRRVEGTNIIITYIVEESALTVRPADSENGAETPIQPPRTKIEKVVTVEDSTADPEHESPNGSPKEKLKVKAATPQEKVKKGGRPPHPRKGKGGKNQYTRDTDDGSPARSASRDVASRDETSDAPPRVGHARLAKADTHDGHGPGRGRPASKGGRGVSMLDMRKRVAGMLAFIQQTQLEMAEAGEMKTPPDERQDGLEPQAQPPESEKDKELKGVMTGIMSGLKAANPDAGGGEEEAKEFKDLSLLKMMDVLTTELVKWQEQFA